MDKKKFFKKTVLLLVALALVGGLGFVWGRHVGKNGSDKQAAAGDTTVYSDSSGLRKELNLKLAEHVALTEEVLRASYDDRDSSTAAVDELDKNSQEIAQIVGGFYGEEAKSTFLKMWQDHITFFVNYTISVKNDDKEGKEQALSDLEDYSQEISEFFAGLNGSISVDSMKPLFTDHRDLIIASINDYTEAKYPEAFDNESKAYAQAGEIADTLADAIIKQFPDKFPG